MKNCIDCNTLIHTPTGRELRCSPCRDRHKKIYSRIYNRNRYGYRAKITDGETP